jgi:protein gp37
VADSKIEWTDRVWNPVRGCSLVSAGCTNCYAMKQAHRFSGDGQAYEGLTRLTTSKGPVWTGAARFVPSMLAAPLRWKKPARIFVNSMSDLFHEDVTNEQIAAVFGVMAGCPQHTFQLLTKRPERMAAFFKWLEDWKFPDDDSIPAHTDVVRFHAVMSGAGSDVPPAKSLDWPLPNVWLGVSCEDQEAADKRIPLLLQTPAAIRFVSAEPLLGPLQLWRINDGSWHDSEGADYYNALTGTSFWRNGDHGIGGGPKLDWVIVGGESGNGARPNHFVWMSAVVQHCAGAGTALFVKQMGAWLTTAAFPPQFTDPAFRVPFKHSKGGDPAEWPANMRVRQFPEVRT